MGRIGIGGSQWPELRGLRVDYCKRHCQSTNPRNAASAEVADARGQPSFAWRLRRSAVLPLEVVGSRPLAVPVAEQRTLATASASPTPLRAAKMNPWACPQPSLQTRAFPMLLSAPPANKATSPQR